MVKYHYLYMMIDFDTKYDQQFELSCKSSKWGILSPPSKTQRHFTQKEKEDVRLNYSVSRNFAESTIKARSVLDNKKLSSKCNFSGERWRLTYPFELYDELLTRILTLRDLHFPVSVLSLQMNAKLVIQAHNPSFSASRSLVEKFFTRHKFALWAHTSISQKLPKQLEGVQIKFRADAPRFTRIGKYSFSLVGNMDDASAFFDIVSSK